MNFVDAVIILLIFLGYFIGKKRGFLPQLVSVVGFFLIVVGAFILKNPVSQFLYEKLPFSNFMGVFKGVTILNIIFYEVMAFTIVLGVLYLVFRLILSVSKLFEKILEVLPIIEFLNKIIGGILGIVENYIVVFIVLYILTLPFFNFGVINDSKLRTGILENTPVLSGMLNNTVVASNEIYGLKEKYSKAYDAKEFNLEALDVLLKYDITTVENIDKLVELKKLKIEDIESVLNKYRK